MTTHDKSMPLLSNLSAGGKSWFSPQWQWLKYPYKMIFKYLTVALK